MNARRVATAGIIAAVYGAVTFLVLLIPGGIGWGPVQFRPSEALVVVAVLTPAAIPGLAIGSALANLTSVASMGAVGLLDVVFGSLGTLLGAAWSWRFRRRTGLALLGPVIFNALIVPAYLPVMLRAAGIGAIPLFGLDLSSAWPVLYLAGVVSIAVSESIVVYGLGWPLLSLLRRVPLPGIETETPGAGVADGGRS
jgi:uncharacterized membrane protein